MNKRLIILVLAFLGSIATAHSQKTVKPLSLEQGVRNLKKLAEVGDQRELAIQFKKLDIENASCEQKVSLDLLDFHYNLTSSSKVDLLRKLKSGTSCVGDSDFFALHTTIGSYYYERALYDSAYFEFYKVVEWTQGHGDTNQLVLALSNLAALYSEMNWKEEALSVALKAYSIASGSESIGELTMLYLENNVSSLQMDLGYFDQVEDFLSDYSSAYERMGDGDIYLLRAVNAARFKIWKANGRVGNVLSALKEVASSPRAFVMTAFFASGDTAAPLPVLEFMYNEFRVHQSVFAKDTSTFISFGLPTIGNLAARLKIDESLRQQVLAYDSYVGRLPLSSDRLGYRLAKALVFKYSDYWEEYLREQQAIDQRDIVYARIQNRILDEFNQQIQSDRKTWNRIQRQRRVGLTLILLSALVLITALLVFIRVRLKFFRALREFKILKLDNDRLIKAKVSQLSYIEELNSVLSSSERGQWQEKLGTVITKMKSGLTSSAFEIPESVFKKYDLTPTESKVLIQLAYGYSNSEIAQLLKISKSYIHNLRSKLRAKLPLKPDEELEDFAAALRKSYEPTTKPADSRTSA